MTDLRRIIVTTETIRPSGPHAVTRRELLGGFIVEAKLELDGWRQGRRASVGRRPQGLGRVWRRVEGLRTTIAEESAPS